MIKLYKPSAFLDYLNSGSGEIEVPEFNYNGEIVLSPSSCVLEAELCGVWTLKMAHPYDNEGRYTYIQKDCVLQVPCKIAREQKAKEQLFRIYEVRDTIGQLEILAKPIAMDSIDEVPVYYKKWTNRTLYDIIGDLNQLYPEKYHIRYTKPEHQKQKSILATDSNLQSIIMGDDENTLLNAYGAEMIYDNFDYVIKQYMGDKDARDDKIFYAANLKGITITENTSNVVTRIYPVSGDGLPLVDDDNFKVQQHVDATDTYLIIDGQEVPAIEAYPIVHALVRRYDDIKLFEEHSSDVRHPQTMLQKSTQIAKANVKAAVRSLSKTYLEKARKGEWNYKSKLANHFDDGNRDYLMSMSWHTNPGVGQFFGDEEGHQLRSAYVNGQGNAHYWVNENGIWDTQHDLIEEWSWHGNSEVGWWYGSVIDGSYGNYPKNQWLKIDKDPNGNLSDPNFPWYWFNQKGYLIESSTYNNDDQRWNPHDPNWIITDDTIIKSRFGLPYGYIFYSYTDAIEYLKDKALMDVGSMEPEPEEGESGSSSSDDHDPNRDIDFRQRKDEANDDSEVWQLFADAIQQGFKWVESTNIAAWDWFEEFGPDDILKNYLPLFKWQEDEKGTWFGYTDPVTNKTYYISNGWVEDGPSIHRWVDADGYEDPDAGDYENEWRWHTGTNGDWYGYADISGVAIRYPRSQYLYVTKDHVWRYFDSEGWLDTKNSDWYYGTRDGVDRLTYQYWKIGNYYWWFDEKGHIIPDLAYVNDMEWHEEEYTNSDGETKTRKWYGDNNGHYLRNCWVEDSSSSHYKLDENGYYEEPEEEDTSEDIDDETTDDSSDDSGDDSGDESSDDYVDPITTDPNHDTLEWTWHPIKMEADGSSYTRYWYGRYKKDADEKDTTVRIGPEGQYLYVSENKTWYSFYPAGATGHEQCEYGAAFLSDANWDWHHDDRGWWYGDKKGTYPMTQWMKINSKWYWFDNAGYADESTDDYADGKNSSSDTGTMDLNREGINPNYSTSEIGGDEGSEYDANREGVRAWIQDEFIEEVRKTCNENYALLRKDLNNRLRDRANTELNLLCVPSLSIDVDFETLSKVQGYDQFKFLEEKYLGDYISVFYSKRGLTTKQRITSLTYDCLLNKIKDVTLGAPKKYIYEKTAGLFVNAGNTYESTAVEELETGWAENSMLSVSKRRQNLEG